MKYLYKTVDATSNSFDAVQFISITSEKYHNLFTITIMFCVFESNHLGQRPVESISWRVLPPWGITSES